MAKPQKTTTRPVGRPKREYTPAQIRKIDQMAEAQCKDTTIALAMDIPVETFRENFRERTEKKRAEGKVAVLLAQYAAASGPDGTTVDRIWFGKQHLEQTDKQEMQADLAVQLRIVSFADAVAEGFDDDGRPTGK